VVTTSELSVAAAEAAAGTDEASSTTAAPSTSTKSNGGTTEPSSGAGDGGSADPAPTYDGAALTSELLSITEAGPRLEIAGRATFDNGTEQWVGNLAGKILVDDADPADPAAPRRVDGALTLTSDDGRTLELRLGGTAVVTDQANGDRTYEFSGPFRLSGDDAGTDAEGGYEATLLRATKDEESTLSISFNGGPSSETHESTTTTTP
jgi:hypothetical protein